MGGGLLQRRRNPTSTKIESMSDGTGAAEPATPRKAVRNRPSKAVAMGSPRFKKIRKLGAGAFGNVFLCIDLATTQEVRASLKN